MVRYCYYAPTARASDMFYSAPTELVNWRKIWFSNISLLRSEWTEMGFSVGIFCSYGARLMMVGFFSIISLLGSDGLWCDIATSLLQRERVTCFCYSARTELVNWRKIWFSNISVLQNEWVTYFYYCTRSKRVNWRKIWFSNISLLRREWVTCFCYSARTERVNWRMI